LAIGIRSLAVRTSKIVVCLEIMISGAAFGRKQAPVAYPDEPSITIPVSLEVLTYCDCVLGGYNNSGAFNVADIVDGYSRLKTGLPEPGYECEYPYGRGNEWVVAMDVNNGCTFNVADIVDGYSKLKTGFPELEPCEDCPPPGWGWAGWRKAVFGNFGAEIG
jgi:hypothetical protein